MEYDEYVRQEEVARKEKKNKWIVWSIIGAFALTIGTCNYLRESAMKEGIFTKPEVGDRFVFTVKGMDRPYKLKAFVGDSVEFYVPMYESYNWKGEKSQSKVSSLEQEGKMYHPALTIFLSKEAVENLKSNPKISLPSGEQAILNTVYGRSRTKF
jgi:hypothetical protein